MPHFSDSQVRCREVSRRKSSQNREQRSAVCGSRSGSQARFLEVAAANEYCSAKGIASVVTRWRSPTTGTWSRERGGREVGEPVTIWVLPRFAEQEGLNP